MTTGTELVQTAQDAITVITCGEYDEMHKSGAPHVLLDVRTKEEFNAGHIDGATHIDRGFLEFEVEQAVSEKETPVVICCATGGRAALAGETLQKLGYTNVMYLDGGYRGYCARNKE